jgi:hypothetical protein
MKRGMTIALALAAGLARSASAQTRDPHMDFHSSVTLADGSRISLTGTYRADLDANADGTLTTTNQAMVEIDLTPPPTGDQPPPVGDTPPPIGDRLFVRGVAVTSNGSIVPCFMPAMVLLALNVVTHADVQRFLGITVTITRARGFVQPPEPEAVLRALGLLLAQVNSLNPAGAARASQLIDFAFGIPPPVGDTPPPIGDIPPPVNDLVCLPQPVATSGR